MQPLTAVSKEAYMAVKQLSVYLENEKGSLAEVAGLLADAGVNCRSMCIADTRDFGVLRIIADEPELAERTLKEAGHAAKLREVVGFEIPDRPGGLAKALELLDKNNINLEYMYVLIPKARPSALVVARVDDNGRTEQLLTENGIRVLSDVNLEA